MEVQIFQHLKGCKLQLFKTCDEGYRVVERDHELILDDVYTLLD